jgi:hypothetical protein
MPHSTVTSKGQTTIPGKIRKALRIKPGDKLGPSACLCWSLSTSTRVEISPQRSADSFPARVSKLIRRFTWTLWIAIENKSPFRGLPDRRDCGDRRPAGSLFRSGLSKVH